MKFIVTFAVALAVASIGLADSPTTAPARSELTESQKIEHLIDHVANMKGAVFVRNGSDHSPAEAAKHLKDKWKRAGSKIKTAEQFIENLASKSSMSGEIYKIRFEDGTV